MPLSEIIVRQTHKQLRLFSLPDPLSQRFGAQFFRALPRMPGVYFFYGRQDELLYIGQSLDLRARIGSYRHVTPEKHPKRTLRLVSRIARIEWEICATAAAAVERERLLLLEHRPPFNRAGVWQGDPWWLKVAVLDHRAHLELTRTETEGRIGPLPSGFRYAFGSLIRCLYRLAHPALPISQYPHRLLGAAAPLALALPFPDASAAARLIAGFAEGNSAQLLAQLDAAPPTSSLVEQEYWLEEIEGLKRYAAKRHKMTISSEGLEPQFIQA